MKRASALVVVLALAACGGDPIPEDNEPDLSEPAAMTLRLSDLPDGFRYGEERGCGGVETTEGQESELDEFLIQSRPRACLGAFAREWGGPPRVVQSALFLFDSGEDAQRAWELRKPLFESFGRIRITKERGEGAFDSDGLQQLGAGEAWRDDRRVVVVYEEGLSGEAGRRFAHGLAEKQRQRIESPSNPEEEDDREIGLDDPAIAIPVYWLGREFDAYGLPTLELYRGDHLRGGGPGNEVKIDYAGDASSVTLDLWKPEGWRRFRQTRLGQVASCEARTSFAVEGGRAEICQGRPNHWRAQVHYDDVVVAVNMPYCFACAGRPAGDPYNSRAGMEAVVRGLRRR